MGIRCTDVRDTSTSSEVKGESFSDTIRTFSSYFDFIIMRHKEETHAEEAAYVVNSSDRPIPILNAGSGKDQHPTQALLDIYTLRRSFEKTGGMEGKTVLMAGDLNRGRTVRVFPSYCACSLALQLFSVRHRALVCEMMCSSI